MRVLVTGGAGFIGSHLTDALLERGDTVTVIDDLSTGRAERLAAGVELHRESITDFAALSRLVRRARPEVICHLAAQPDVRISVADPTGDTGVNVLGTINVLEAARAVDAQVIFASTGGALYGTNAEIPATESLVPTPEAPYGTAKYCAEQYIGLYNRLHRTSHAILRIGNVYGPRQDPAGEAGVVSIFCGMAVAGQQPTVFGDGSQTRDYIYVGDAVDAFLATIDHGNPGVWNIGTGTSTSILELLDLVGRTAGKTSRPTFAAARLGEMKHSVLDVARAARDLGWRARTSLADGIAKVYKWVEANEPVRGER